MTIKWEWTAISNAILNVNNKIADYCFRFCLQLDKISKEQETLDEIKEIESLLAGS